MSGPAIPGDQTAERAPICTLMTHGDARWSAACADTRSSGGGAHPPDPTPPSRCGCRGAVQRRPRTFGTRLRSAGGIRHPAASARRIDGPRPSLSRRRGCVVIHRSALSPTARRIDAAISASTTRPMDGLYPPTTMAIDDETDRAEQRDGQHREPKPSQRTGAQHQPSPARRTAPLDAAARWLCSNRSPRYRRVRPRCSHP
jgi:hypothetical protein